MVIIIITKFILKHNKAVKAKQYLDTIIGTKIDELQVVGKPNVNDGTALNAMVFATTTNDDDASLSGFQREDKLLLTRRKSVQEKKCNWKISLTASQNVGINGRQENRERILATENKQQLVHVF